MRLKAVYAGVLTVRIALKACQLSYVMIKYSLQGGSDAVSDTYNKLPGPVKADLDAFLGSGSLPHALILHGSDKELSLSAAGYISAYAVCRGDDRPCFKCSECVKAMTFNHPDIMWVKGTGTNSKLNVSDIRRVCADTYIKPNEADCKVYILEDCELMNTQSQNAFLKSLEEPAGNVVFILQCVSPYALLETVRSRCVALNTDAGRENSEACAEVREKAMQIVRALCKSSEYPLLNATYLNGANRDRYTEVMKELKSILCASLTGKADANRPDIPPELLRTVGRKRLVSMISVAEEAIQGMKRNTNINLFSTWLCSSLERIKEE